MNVTMNLFQRYCAILYEFIMDEESNCIRNNIYIIKLPVETTYHFIFSQSLIKLVQRKKQLGILGICFADACYNLDL